MEIYAQNETALRRVAHRFSLCADDAEDALQRGLEILLRKAPSDDPRQLIRWLQTVVRREALAIRHERERTLAGPAAVESEPDREDWVSRLPASADGPPERAERQEAVGRWREALQTLKPQELRALTLLAEGYSYAEIGEITGFSPTKVNRCLAEGRERFRGLVARSEDGSRCAEMRPLLSAFCDGEAKAEQVAELREHLRACAGCRATLRTYRAAPAAAAVLVPSLPLPRSLWERVQDALGDLFGRVSGGGGTASQAAAGSGAGGVAVAKIAVVCLGAAGGAAACVAGGLVPSPLHLGHEAEQPRIERHLSEVSAPAAPEPRVEYAPAPEPKPKTHPKAKPSSEKPSAPQEPAEVDPASAEPLPAESSTEYVPPPAPEPAPAASSGAGSPAGEFGP